MTGSAGDTAARLRLGVVGCGAVTERYHLPALLASPEVEVVAFVDPALERAAALAAQAGDAAALPSYAELATLADAALVAVPNALHAPVACDLLEAGLHVLVEKPMARSGAECDRMLASARAAGVVLAVGHDFRYFPVAAFARHLFASDMLGAVRSVDVRQNAGARWPAVSSAILSPAAGGGAFLDFGVHLLDLLLWWLGPMEPLAYSDDATGGVESDAVCDCALSNGAPVHLEVSRTRVMRDSVIAECERGTVEISVFEPAFVRLLPGAGLALQGGVTDPEFDRAPLRTVFGRQLGEFVAAVRGGRDPLVGGREGRAAVALVERCYALRRPLRHPWDYPEVYGSLATGAGR